MLARPLLVASDLHLAPGGCSRIAGDLEALIRSHSGHEIILNGDTFSLSSDPRPTDPLMVAEQVLGSEAGLAAALRDHLGRGDPVTLVAGNHDAALTAPDARGRLVRALGCDDSVPLSIVPWLVRRGDVWFEHGHLYDPDNAPLHPLAPWRLEHEPLGVVLTRRLVAELGADEFAHAHETTPLAGLVRSLRSYGTKAPRLIGRYFATALSLWWRAGRQPGLDAAHGAGRARLEDEARQVGIPVDELEQMATEAPRPTHAQRWPTFRRLYLDRSLAFITLFGGGLGGLCTGTVWPALVALVAAAYLVGSVLVSGNRYRGLTEERLRDAALRVADLTAATLVVFGHSHLADQAPRYLNTGCFACRGPGGRSYLLVDAEGRGELKQWVAP